jgi:ribosomal protein S27E
MVAISDNRNDIADVRCLHCGRYFTIFYNREDMVNWLSGSLAIQDAMDYLTAGERELFLSGTCNDCFDSMFSMLDNNE